MFLFNEYKKFIMIIAAVLLSVFAYTDFVSARENTEIKLCEEDEMLLFYAGQGKASKYDFQGNYLGRCRYYLEPFVDVWTEKKEGFFVYRLDGIHHVYSLSEEKNIFELSDEEYSLRYTDNVFLVTEKSTGILSLYNGRGDRIFSTQEAMIQGNPEYTGDLRETSEGYLVGICSTEYGKRAKADHFVFIDRESTETKEISAPVLTEAFSGHCLDVFGDKWLVEEKENEEQENEKKIWIYDSDGNLLLDQIDDYITERSDGSSRIKFVVKEDRDSYLVYDENLQEVMTVPMQGEIRSLYSNGYFKGITYEELDNAVCAGTILYNGSKYVPYALTEKEVAVYANGKQIRVPLNEGEQLLEISDAFAIIRTALENEAFSEKVVELSSGEILEEYQYDGHKSDAALGEGFYIRWGEGKSDKAHVKIVNDKKEICLSSDNITCHIFQGRYVSLRRGIYYGIADMYGNWIIRAPKDWEP